MPADCVAFLPGESFFVVPEGIVLISFTPGQISVCRVQEWIGSAPVDPQWHRGAISSRLNDFGPQAGVLFVFGCVLRWALTFSALGRTMQRAHGFLDARAVLCVFLIISGWEAPSFHSFEEKAFCACAHLLTFSARFSDWPSICRQSKFRVPSLKVCLAVHCRSSSLVVVVAIDIQCAQQCPAWFVFVLPKLQVCIAQCTTILWWHELLFCCPTYMSCVPVRLSKMRESRIAEWFGGLIWEVADFHRVDVVGGLLYFGQAFIHLSLCFNYCSSCWHGRLVFQDCHWL